MPRKPSKASAKLRLDAALDVEHVIERRDQLLASIAAQPEPFTLDLSAVASCDTAGLQLLCAARRSIALSGREWRPAHSSEAFLRACSAVGIQPEQLGL